MVAQFHVHDASVILISYKTSVAKNKHKQKTASHHIFIIEVPQLHASHETTATHKSLQYKAASFFPAKFERAVVMAYDNNIYLVL